MLDQLACVGRQLVEAADADRELAHGPRIGQRHRDDRHGPHHAARGGLGHDADPDITLDQAAHRIEAAQLHAQPQRLADARGLVRQEALERACAVETDEVVVQHVREGNLRTFRERMIAGDDQHEPVLAKGIGFERARVDGGGDDAEIGHPFGDEPDDLVAQPFLEVDADIGVRGQERAQRLGQEFGQGIGVGEHPDLAGEAAGIGAEVLAQPLGLAQDRARMLQQGAAGLGRGHALTSAHQQRRAQCLLHVADSGGGRGQREMRALRPAGDAAGLDHVTKQAQIDEVETHVRPRGHLAVVGPICLRI